LDSTTRLQVSGERADFLPQFGKGQPPFMRFDIGKQKRILITSMFGPVFQDRNQVIARRIQVSEKLLQIHETSLPPKG
jgi:hypothetical protein